MSRGIDPSHRNSAHECDLEGKRFQSLSAIRAGGLAVTPKIRAMRSCGFLQHRETSHIEDQKFWRMRCHSANEQNSSSGPHDKTSCCTKTAPGSRTIARCTEPAAESPQTMCTRSLSIAFYLEILFCPRPRPASTNVHERRIQPKRKE